MSLNASHVPTTVSKVPFPLNVQIVQIQAARNHSLALDATGVVYYWGKYDPLPLASSFLFFLQFSSRFFSPAFYLSSIGFEVFPLILVVFLLLPPFLFHSHSFGFFSGLFFPAPLSLLRGVKVANLRAQGEGLMAIVGPAEALPPPRLTKRVISQVEV